MPSSQPYEHDDVTAILIEGMADFLPIKLGSLKEITLAGEPPLICLEAVDAYGDEDKIFLFANKLVAVKFVEEKMRVIDGGKQPKISRPLP